MSMKWTSNATLRNYLPSWNSSNKWISHPQDRVLRLREDKVTEKDQRDIFQDVAPATENGLYLVPKVID